MLKSAQLYKERLNEVFTSQWYDRENIFYNGSAGAYSIELPDNNYDYHNFVSVDKYNNIIGYISYNVDWAAMSATNLGIISFEKGNLIFADDVFKSIVEIFTKYGLNRLYWWCYADNPAIKSYRNLIRIYGGKECGYLRQAAKLQDGKLHDIVEFEILRSECNFPTKRVRKWLR